MSQTRRENAESTDLAIMLYAARGFVTGVYATDRGVAAARSGRLGGFISMRSILSASSETYTSQSRLSMIFDTPATLH